MFQSTGISTEEKKFKIDFQKMAILDFGSEQFLQFISTSRHGTSYQVSSQLAFWLRRCSNQIFKMVAMAAILDSASERFSLFFIYKSPKFTVKWPLGSGEVVQNRFLRWQRWWPSWISDQNN